MALRGQLEPTTVRPDRRTATRWKLHLPAERSTASGTSEVLILDISMTGLLIKTAGDLSLGETIALNIPGTSGVSAVVRWSDEQRFGCKFIEPISEVVLKAVLARSSVDGEVPRDGLHSPELRAIDTEDDGAPKMSATVETGWLVGFAVLTTAVIAAAAWSFFS